MGAVAYRLLGYLWRHQGRLLAALAAMGVLAVTTGAYPLLIDLISTALFKGPAEAAAVLGPAIERLAGLLGRFGLAPDLERLTLLGQRGLFVLFGLVVLLKAASQAVRFWAMGALALQVVRELRDELFRAIVRQSAAFFGAEASGLLISRVINDVATVERAATYAIPVLVGDVLRVTVLASVCLWQYPELSLVSLVVLPAAALPIVRFGKLLKRYARLGQDELAGLTHRLSETLGGIRVVQVYGGERVEIGRFAAQGEAWARAMMKSVRIRALQTPIMELVGVGALIATVLWADWRIRAGAIRPGEVIAFLLALVLLYEPIKAIARSSAVVLPGLVAAERVFEWIDRPPSVLDAADARPLAPMCDVVAFERVSFRYPGSDRDAVSGLDLRLEKGKVVALVGPSGSGKSTVAALLPRLWDVTGGRITIDGVDIRQVTLASLRAQIAVVSQETHLFDDSLRANIAYGRPDASDGEIEAAARSAHAHEFIAQLPEGYQSRAGERGIRLSGGQRQRIAIARAFLKGAPILVLDEATSALDAESEREVQRALDSLLADRTALVIAHRLSTVRQADEIVVLDRGRVAERGPHRELARATGVYARLLAAAEERVE